MLLWGCLTTLQRGYLQAFLFKILHQTSTLLGALSKRDAFAVAAFCTLFSDLRDHCGDEPLDV